MRHNYLAMFTVRYTYNTYGNTYTYKSAKQNTERTNRKSVRLNITVLLHVAQGRAGQDMDVVTYLFTANVKKFGSKKYLNFQIDVIFHENLNDLNVPIL